ncbi:MAG: long-chain fatty acid--CoA ligase [Bacteroidetes bacterium]|nr:MAG: long-chain fatty acid--CoA ligase [Bacteroidota bacterium]
MSNVTRTFDVLTNAEENYNHDIALAVKRNGKWETFSTEEYRQNADIVSLGLLALGLGKGDKVAIVTDNRPEWNFLETGISQIGCVQVTVYPSISETEYRHILSHSESKLLFVATEELYHKLKPVFDDTENVQELYSIDKIEGVKNWKEVQELGKSKESELRPLLKKRRDEVTPEDLSTLIYTSGTTGLSKGVMLTHNNIISNVKLADDFIQYLHPGDRALSFLPLSHILERTGNYLWQYHGLKIYYAETIETIGDDMRDIKANTFITVPRVFEKVYDKIVNKGRELKGIKKSLFFWALEVGDKFDPNPANRSAFYNFKLSIANKLIFSKWREALGGELKGVIAGGAALQPRLARVFWAAKIFVQEGYGLTETSPLVSANNVYHPYVRFGWVGYIPKSIQVKIADDGEILVKGENVMKGYYKDPEKTSQAIDKEGWFHTGDIGEVDDQRMLRITDRKKEMFKLSGGKYVAPQQVENTFKESMFIEQIMVVGENEKHTAALIVPDFKFLGDWCKIHHIAVNDNKEMIGNPDVVARYEKEVEKYNKDLNKVMQIKKFKLVCEDWTPENGFLSPTQKLKRKVILANYKNLLNEIYEKNS